jgi:hypothetical protein
MHTSRDSLYYFIKQVVTNWLFLAVRTNNTFLLIAFTAYPPAVTKQNPAPDNLIMSKSKQSIGHVRIKIYSTSIPEERKSTSALHSKSALLLLNISTFKVRAAAATDLHPDSRVNPTAATDLHLKPFTTGGYTLVIKQLVI